MSVQYVLLDAIAIQSTIFETNTLRIILGSSFRLAQWQERCKELCADHCGALVTSAGGNVLARFENGKGDAFKHACIEDAPDMEVAWAITDGQEKPLLTWNVLQQEIASYKAGDRDPSDYPSEASVPVTKGLCRFCGTRRSDGGAKIDVHVPCAPCRKRYREGEKLHDDAFKPAGDTTMEKAMALPSSLKTIFDGRPRANSEYALETYPEKLDELVAKPGQDGEVDPENSELLAVVVIDLNELGTKVKETVRSAGFDGLNAFSKKLEEDLWGVFEKQITILAKAPGGIGILKKDGMFRKFIRFRPLLLGGDDAVFAMPAPLWPDFVEEILEGLFNKGYPACTGVAIARHTFPINKLVQMAEELVASAKARSRCSGGAPSIDWHLHQETAFSTLRAARRRKHIKEDYAAFEVSTRRPYTLEDFRKLRSDTGKFDLGSNRKEFTLHEAMVEGRNATRDALVHVFLRGEDNTLRYASLWPHVLQGNAGPLWDETKFQGHDGTTHTLFDTRMADLLELRAFTMQEDRDD